MSSSSSKSIGLLLFGLVCCSTLILVTVIESSSAIGEGAFLTGVVCCSMDMAVFAEGDNCCVGAVVER